MPRTEAEFSSTLWKRQFMGSGTKHGEGCFPNTNPGFVAVKIRAFHLVKRFFHSTGGMRVGIDFCSRERERERARENEKQLNRPRFSVSSQLFQNS